MGERVLAFHHWDKQHAIGKALVTCMCDLGSSDREKLFEVTVQYF
jgi:hypothetical protein